MATAQNINKKVPKVKEVQQSTLNNNSFVDIMLETTNMNNKLFDEFIRDADTLAFLRLTEKLFLKHSSATFKAATSIKGPSTICSAFSSFFNALSKAKQALETKELKEATKNPIGTLKQPRSNIKPPSVYKQPYVPPMMNDDSDSDESVATSSSKKSSKSKKSEIISPINYTAKTVKKPTILQTADDLLTTNDSENDM